MSITTDNIPPEVVEAAARAVHNIDRKIVGEDDWPTWEALSPTDKRRRLHRARAAILAALSAWPGSDHLAAGEVHDKPVLLLLLPPEKGGE